MSCEIRNQLYVYHGQHGDLSIHLSAESVQEPDCVNLEYWMYSTWGCLEILEDVIGEELHDINKFIRGCDTMLCKQNA